MCAGVPNLVFVYSPLAPYRTPCGGKPSSTAGHNQTQMATKDGVMKKEKVLELAAEYDRLDKLTADQLRSQQHVDAAQTEIDAAKEKIATLEFEAKQALRNVRNPE